MKKLILHIFFTTTITTINAQAVWNNTTFVHRNNQQILDGQNNVIKLNGVNLGGWLMWEGWIWGGGFTAEKDIYNNIQTIVGSTSASNFRDSVYHNFITKADIQKISQECFNVVRIPFNHNILEDDFNPYIYKQSGWNLLDSVLQWCEDYSVYAVLDLHSAPGGQSTSFTADPDFIINLWNGSINQTRTKRLWKAIANRYQNRGIIAAYDLLNEPNVTSDADMLTMYHDIIDSVRSVDNNHMLSIEGNNYAQNFSMFTSLPDPNMNFQFHMYSWFYNNADSIAAHINYNTNISNSLNVPIWCGEWGENDYAHLDTTLTILNNPIYKVSGSSSWTWKKMKTTLQYPYYNGIDTTLEWNTSMAWVSNTTLPAPLPLVMQTGINSFINNIKEQNCTFNIPLSNILNACLPSAIKDETEQNNINIYPNPYTTQTTIAFIKEQKNTTIKITDLLGKEIKTINFTGTQLVIDKGEMKAGIYFVQTTDTQKHIYNRKIIIQ